MKTTAEKKFALAIQILYLEMVKRGGAVFAREARRCANKRKGIKFDAEEFMETMFTGNHSKKIEDMNEYKELQILNQAIIILNSKT